MIPYYGYAHCPKCGTRHQSFDSCPPVSDRRPDGDIDRLTSAIAVVQVEIERLRAENARLRTVALAQLTEPKDAT